HTESIAQNRGDAGPCRAGERARRQRQDDAGGPHLVRQQQSNDRRRDGAEQQLSLAADIEDPRSKGERNAYTDDGEWNRANERAGEKRAAGSERAAPKRIEYLPEVVRQREVGDHAAPNMALPTR